MPKGDDPESLLKKGIKLVSPNPLLLRFKPDWTAAVPVFEEAANGFRIAKNWAKAKEAFERAAHAQNNAGSPWHAGKDYEAAAQMAYEMRDVTGVSDMTREAMTHYALASRANAAAQALSKGAQMLKQHDPDLAARLYREAIQTAEGDMQEHLTIDVYREAIQALVQMGKWPDAAVVLMKFAVACDVTNQTNAQSKAYLSCVVVHLTNRDAPQAWKCYQDAMTVPTFASSDEALAADALFVAYASGDPAKVRECVQSHATFRYIENSVALLAKALPAGDMLPQAQFIAQALGANQTAGVDLASDPQGTAGALNEDDLA